MKKNLQLQTLTHKHKSEMLCSIFTAIDCQHRMQDAKSHLESEATEFLQIHLEIRMQL